MDIHIYNFKIKYARGPVTKIQLYLKEHNDINIEADSRIYKKIIIENTEETVRVIWSVFTSQEKINSLLIDVAESTLQVLWFSGLAISDFFLLVIFIIVLGQRKDERQGVIMGLETAEFLQHFFRFAIFYVSLEDTKKNHYTSVIFMLY